MCVRDGFMYARSATVRFQVSWRPADDGFKLAHKASVCVPSLRVPDRHKDNAWDCHTHAYAPTRTRSWSERSDAALDNR